MCSAQRNFRRLKALYERALAIKSAIPHPRIMGAIREHGGKMHMREKAWEAAHTDFFEAFKSYDDAGSPRRCVHAPAPSLRHTSNGSLFLQTCSCSVPPHMGSLLAVGLPSSGHGGCGVACSQASGRSPARGARAGCNA